MSTWWFSCVIEVVPLIDSMLPVCLELMGQLLRVVHVLFVCICQCLWIRRPQFCLWFPYKTYRRCEPHNWLCNHDRSCLSLYICGWQIVDWLCLKLCTSTCIVIWVVLTDLFWANCGMSWVNSWMVVDDKFRERLEMSVSACCDAYLERRSDILVR